MLYGVHCEKCYSLREIERNEIILRDDIDVTVFPAYTLSAEVTCPASQSTDVTKLSERGNDNVFFCQSFPVRIQYTKNKSALFFGRET